MKGIIKELTKCKSCKYWIEEATTSGHDNCIIFLVREFNGETHRIKTTKKLFEDDFYNFLSFDLNISLLDKKNYIIEYNKDSIIFKEARKEKGIYTLCCHQIVPCDSLFTPTSISIKSDLSTLINKISIKCELTKHALAILKVEGELRFIVNYISSPDLVLEYIRRVNEGNRLLDSFESYFITQESVKIKNNKMRIKYNIPASSLYKPINLQLDDPTPLCDSSFYDGPTPLNHKHEIRDRISMLINIMNNATNFKYSFDDSNDMILLIHNELVLAEVSFTTEEFKQAFINKYITDNNYMINAIEKEGLIKNVKLHFRPDHIDIAIRGLDSIRLPFRRKEYEKDNSNRRKL